MELRYGGPDYDNAPPQSAVQAGAERLTRAADALHKAVAALSARLSPVLSPAGGGLRPSEQGSSSPRVMHSPLAETLEATNAALELVQSELQSIHGRLEI